MFTLVPPGVWFALLMGAALTTVVGYVVSGDEWRGRSGRDWSLLIVGAALTVAFLVLFLGSLVATLFEALQDAIPDRTPAPAPPTPIG